MYEVTRIAALVAFVACVAAASRVAAQDTPRFEVASIKINTSGDSAKAMGPEPGGRFGARNVPLRDLLAIAYGIPPAFADVRVAGGPGWMDSARFDVAAKADRELPPDQIALRVRALLADRMGATTHWERRDSPVYVLEFANPDRRLGPNLRRAQIDCNALREAARAARGGAATSRSPAPAGPVCTGRFIPGTITGSALTMETLANSLGRFAGRIVQDGTGTSGSFDFELHWTPSPDQIPALPPGVPPPQFDPSGPSLFTAIQEQLGLKLDPRRAPIDVLVVDTVFLPKPD
jgi:uncharacterized protein (TIGR03435 family)